MCRFRVWWVDECVVGWGHSGAVAESDGADDGRVATGGGGWWGGGLVHPQYPTGEP